MAVKKPLVLTNGEIEQLQSGDTIDVQPDSFQATFTSTAIAGAPVYVDGGTSVDLAQATTSGVSDAIGLAATAVTAAATGTVIFNGVVTLTTAEWDAVAGTTGGLTAGSKYYLSDAAAGRIVEQGSIPTVAGRFVVELGEALDTTDLIVTIRRRIKL